MGCQAVAMRLPAPGRTGRELRQMDGGPGLGSPEEFPDLHAAMCCSGWWRERG